MRLKNEGNEVFLLQVDAARLDVKLFGCEKMESLIANGKEDDPRKAILVVIVGYGER